jgi:ADP-ribose pyrophosphatase
LAEEKIISSKMIFRGKVVSLKVDKVVGTTGEETTREIVLHNACVAIIPLDSCGNILMVRQYREAIEKDLLEIPAGGIEPGEDRSAAVNRECQEEIGFRPGKIEELIGFYSSPGFTTEYLYLYLATELTRAKLIAEDTAGIEVVCVKPRHVRSLVRSGAICDAKSVAGLLYYLDHKKKRKNAE